MSNIESDLEAAAKERKQREEYNKKALEIKAKLVAARYGTGGVTVDMTPPPGALTAGILTIPEIQSAANRGKYYQPQWTSRDEHPTERDRRQANLGTNVVMQGVGKVEISRIPVNQNGFVASASPKPATAPVVPPPAVKLERPVIGPEDLF